MPPSTRERDENQPMDEDIIDDAEDQDDEEEEEEYLVEALLDKRKVGGRTEYLVKWENYDHDQNTWEPTDNLNCASLIAAYEENEANKRRAKVKNSATKRPSRNSSANGSVISSSRDGESSRRLPDSSDTDEDIELEVVRKRISKSRGQLEIVPERTENTRPAREQPKGFARNLDLDTIISGIYDEDEKIYFIVRWKSRGVEMIPVEELEEKAPRELCAYYRQRLYHSMSAPQDKIVWELFKQSNDIIED